MDWSLLLTGTLPPLLGVIVGGFATYYTQTNALKKQFDREIEKEKEARDIESLKVYSEILKLDGENLILEPDGGNVIDFNLEVYRSKIRPVLYSKLYLLDQSVMDKVRNMDYVISEADFNEELDRDQSDFLIKGYMDTIGLMEKYLQGYREK